MLQRIYQQYGKRKCNKHAHIRVAIVEEVNQLTDSGENKYCKKISCFIFCISAAFGDHKRKYWQSQSSEYTEYLYPGEEKETDVVDKHRYRRDDL